MKPPWLYELARSGRMQLQQVWPQRRDAGHGRMVMIADLRQLDVPEFGRTQRDEDPNLQPQNEEAPDQRSRASRISQAIDLGNLVARERFELPTQGL